MRFQEAAEFRFPISFVRSREKHCPEVPTNDVETCIAGWLGERQRGRRAEADAEDLVLIIAHDGHHLRAGPLMDIKPGGVTSFGQVSLCAQIKAVGRGHGASRVSVLRRNMDAVSEFQSAEK
jgi:hypothetical protein